MWSTDVIGNAANATTAVGAELASLRESHAPALLGWVLLGGVLVAFTGHSLLTPLVFLVGASPAVAFAFYVASALELDSLADGQAALLFVTTVIGIASGLLACRLLLPVAAFALAAALGAVAAAVLQSVLLYRLLPSRPELLFSIGAAFLALAFGALSLRVPDAMVMASTAGIGSYIAVSAVGVLAGDWPAELAPLARSAAARVLPAYVRLGYAAAILTLTALGTYTQARVRRARGDKDLVDGRGGGGAAAAAADRRGGAGGGGGDERDLERGGYGPGGQGHTRRVQPPSPSRDGGDGYDEDDWEQPPRSSRGSSRKPPRRHRQGGGGGADGAPAATRPPRGGPTARGYGSTAGSGASDEDETRSLVDGGRYGRRGHRGGDESDMESGRAPSVEGRRTGGGDDGYDTFAKAAHGLAAAPLKSFDGPGEDAAK